MNNQSSSLEFSHFPVMLNEVIKLSSISVGGRFIDCTFGGGVLLPHLTSLENGRIPGVMLEFSLIPNFLIKIFVVLKKLEFQNLHLHLYLGQIAALFHYLL